MSPPVFRFDEPDSPWHGQPADDVLVRAAEAAADPQLREAVERSDTGNVAAGLLLRVLWRWQVQAGEVDVVAVSRAAARLHDAARERRDARIRELLGECPRFPASLIRLREALRFGLEVDDDVRAHLARRLSSPEPDSDLVGQYLKGVRRTLRGRLDRPDMPVRCCHLVLDADWPGPEVSRRPSRSANRFLALVPVAILEGEREAVTLDPVEPPAPVPKGEPNVPELGDVEDVDATLPPIAVRSPEERQPTRPRPPWWLALGAASAVGVLAMLGWRCSSEAVGECPMAPVLEEAGALLEGRVGDAAAALVAETALSCSRQDASALWVRWSEILSTSDHPLPSWRTALDLEARLRAFEASPEPRLALLAYEAHLWAQQDLDAVLDRLDPRRVIPELDKARMEAALARRDVVRALGIANASSQSDAQGWIPTLEGWLHSTPIESREPLALVHLDEAGAQLVGPRTLPGDRHAIVQLVDPLRPKLVRELLWDQHAELQYVRDLGVLDGRRLLAGMCTDGDTAVLEVLVDGSLRLVKRFDAADVFPGEEVDLDGDGRHELAVALGGRGRRGVALLRWEGDALVELPDPAPELTALNSEAFGLVALDAGSYLVGVAKWRGNGLYRGTLTGLDDRRQVAPIRSLARLGRNQVVAVAHDDMGPATTWPAGSPWGGSTWLQRWRIEGRTPVLEDAVSVWPTLGAPRQLQADPVEVGDFDGDGRSDVRVTMSMPGSALSVLVRDSEAGWSAPLRMVGLGGGSFGDYDGDGRDELLVRTGPGHLLLGYGKAPPPVVVTPEPRRLRPPPEVSPDLRLKGSALVGAPWRVTDPLGVRLDNGMQAILEGPRHEVARLPVVRTAGPVALNLDLDVDALRWSAEIRLELVQRGAPVASSREAIGVGAGGGGGSILRQARCTPTEAWRGLGLSHRPVPTGATPERLRVRMVENPTGGLVCSLWVDGVLTDEEVGPAAGSTSRGALDLVVVGHAFQTGGSEAKIRAIAVSGLALDEHAAAPDALTALYTRWARGEKSVDLLDALAARVEVGEGGDQGWLRLAALAEQLGLPKRADRALARWLDLHDPPPGWAENDIPWTPDRELWRALMLDTALWDVLGRRDHALEASFLAHRAWVLATQTNHVSVDREVERALLLPLTPDQEISLRRARLRSLFLPDASALELRRPTEELRDSLIRHGRSDAIEDVMVAAVVAAARDDLADDALALAQELVETSGDEVVRLVDSLMSDPDVMRLARSDPRWQPLLEAALWRLPLPADAIGERALDVPFGFPRDPLPAE